MCNFTYRRLLLLVGIKLIWVELLFQVPFTPSEDDTQKTRLLNLLFTCGAFRHTTKTALQVFPQAFQVK